jgi:hypothetical protein
MLLRRAGYALALVLGVTAIGALVVGSHPSSSPRATPGRLSPATTASTVEPRVVAAPGPTAAVNAPPGWTFVATTHADIPGFRYPGGPP